MFLFWKRQRELPFSVSLQHVFRCSREEALRLRNDYIGPEHLLLAMLAVPESGAARLLDTLLVSPALFGHRIAEVMRGHRLRPDQPLPTGSIALTVEAEQALHSSQRVARQLQAPELEALHVLLPLLADPTGRGALLGAEFGLTFDLVLARIPQPAGAGRQQGTKSGFLAILVALLAQLPDMPIGALFWKCRVLGLHCSIVVLPGL